MLDHLDKLTPDGGKKAANEGSYFCPVCGAKNFKVDLKTGKYSTFTCDCATTEAGKKKIRDAVSPAQYQGGNGSWRSPRPIPRTKPEAITPNCKGDSGDSEIDKNWRIFLGRCGDLGSLFPKQHVLSEGDARNLADSGISPENAALSGICSLARSVLVKDFGISPTRKSPQGDIETILNEDDTYLTIPYFDLDGKLQEVRWQEDSKHSRTGDRVPYVRVRVDATGGMKYTSCKGSEQLIYLSVAGKSPADAIKRTQANLLLITEGEKKAIAACLNGFPCVGLPGIFLKTSKFFRSTPERRDIWDDLNELVTSFKNACLVWDNDCHARYLKEESLEEVDKQHTFSLASNRLFVALYLCPIRDGKSLASDALNEDPEAFWTTLNMNALPGEVVFSEEEKGRSHFPGKFQYILLPATTRKLGLDDLLMDKRGEACLRELLEHKLPGLSVEWKEGEEDAKGLYCLELAGTYTTEPTAPKKPKKPSDKPAWADPNTVRLARQTIIKWSIILNNKEIIRSDVWSFGTHVWKKTVFDNQRAAIENCYKQALDLLKWRKPPQTQADTWKVGVESIDFQSWLSQGRDFQVFDDCIFDLRTHEIMPLQPLPGLLRKCDFPYKAGSFERGNKDLDGISSSLQNLLFKKESDRPKFLALMAALAHAISPVTPNQKSRLILLWGVSGSGKSLLTSLVKKLTTCQTIHIHSQLAANGAAGGSFNPDVLGAKLLIEEDVKTLLTSPVVTVLNTLCDNDPVPVKALYRDAQSLVLNSRIWITANQPLKLCQEDREGLYRRLFTIELTRKLDPEKGRKLAEVMSNPAKLADFYQVLLKIQQDGLVEKEFSKWDAPGGHGEVYAKNQNEGDAFVHWIRSLQTFDDPPQWDGTKLSKIQHDLKVPDSSYNTGSEVPPEWKPSNANSEGHWTVKATSLKAAFTDFCKEQGLKPCSMSAFVKKLCVAGFKNHRKVAYRFPLSPAEVNELELAKH